MRTFCLILPTPLPRKPRAMLDALTLLPGSNHHSKILTAFVGDTEKHEMSILHDDGVYRHLQFQAPGTLVGRFEITTTPGMLTITGDMGTYVFARHDDMFQFFRQGSVNAAYWGEKLLAVNARSGHIEHAEEAFTGFIVRDFWDRRLDYDTDEAATIWRHIRNEILAPYVDRSTDAARQDLLRNFSIHGYTYTDTWDCAQTYSYAYLWCCHAILWAIRCYDAAQAATIIPLRRRKLTDKELRANGWKRSQGGWVKNGAFYGQWDRGAVVGQFEKERPAEYTARMNLDHALPAALKLHLINAMADAATVRENVRAHEESNGTR